ncbi:MAG: DUF4149 domain-containing protein [Acetobacterales bacterium]
MTVFLNGAALLAIAAMFGGMAFFAAVYTPMIFRTLEKEDAAKLLRATFPVYYLAMGATGVAAALLALFADRREEAGIVAIVALFFIFMRKFALPRIEYLRDAKVRGIAGAEKHFRSLHRTSMAVNLLQMLGLGWVLVAMAG